MKEHYHAVVIGINRYKDKQRLPELSYAEKDCEDLRMTLTDRNSGLFLPENITMLVGSAATTRKVQEALYGRVIRQCTPDDTVLVYFSGHGFVAGDRSFAYLATYDVLIKNLVCNPDDGLRMDRIHDDILMKSPAKNVVFILDCCHSGALTPSSIRDKVESPTRGLIDTRFFSSAQGRVAVVACPPNAVSRESSDLQNGIFTHYVLRALKGEAVDPISGEVTIDDLLGYVRYHAPSDQPPGSYGQWYGRIVLSKPGPSHVTTSDKIALRITETEPSRKAALSNPLEAHIPFIRDMVSHLEKEEMDETRFVENRILDAVRSVSKAGFVFLLRFDGTNWAIRSHSESGDSNPPINDAASRVVASLSRKLSGYPSDYDSHYIYDASDGASKAFMVIPLHLDQIKEFMIIYGLEVNTPVLSGVHSKILAAVYTATGGMTSLRPAVVESVILDSLKKSYGHVPMELYMRRFDLFRTVLAGMDIYFEPILNLEPMHFCGWEALARDPESERAPANLFATAELWGRQFTTELDIYFFRTAIKRFKEELTRARISQSHAPDLSINVYPVSLMRRGYFSAVREALRESGLVRRNVILEISEKSPIPEEAGDVDAFKAELEQYVRDLGIGFAIDDFGVGYASVSRLVRLNPSYVKIDRDALQHEFSDLTIRFVIDVVARGRLSAPRVMIEGFDSASRLTLKDLYDLGVRYVQGYVVGRAGPRLYTLEAELQQYLEGLITGGLHHARSAAGQDGQSQTRQRRAKR